MYTTCIWSYRKVTMPFSTSTPSSSFRFNDAGWKRERERDVYIYIYKREDLLRAYSDKLVNKSSSNNYSARDIKLMRLKVIKCY